MFYVKNVPTWERVARVVIPICPAVLGIQHFGFGLVGLMILASALGISVTGIVGWCPMCAMVHRKRDQKTMTHKA